jgi:beta-galactosidase
MTVTAPHTVYKINKVTGLICSIVDNGREMLASEMKPTNWRAPTDNDRKIKKEWLEFRYNDETVNCRELTYAGGCGKCATVKAKLTVAPLVYCPVLFLDVSYTVYADGSLKVNTDAKLNKARLREDFEMPHLPRFGFEFKMPEENERLVYFGRGEAESYIDKHYASKKGVFETTVTKHFEHYVRPQENMAHSDTDWVAVSNLSGHGLFALSTGKSFSFNCAHFTAHQLTNTKHDYELVPLKETVVNIDYRHTGIGSNSCGPVLHKQWRFDDNEFTFEFRLKPAFINDLDPFEEYGRK